MTDTIFAQSSGAPPAAIGIVRISGPAANAALRTLCGRLPAPRRASLQALRGTDGDLLDRALVLWLPGPRTATGEDMVELHCHGGRAVLASVQAALALLPDLRMAEPGEFTRRAFANGRIDLAEAEGLADLLTAETELQRRNALNLSGGALSRHVERWRETLLAISAEVEAMLDFADEDDVATMPDRTTARMAMLAQEIGGWLTRPRAELLRDGVRVVLAGPPNAGKSTLFNALVDADAAIVTPIAGTTRDLLTRSVALEGVPFVFVDTAGLNEVSDDPIERMGIVRAHAAMEEADVVLWLGPEGEGPSGAWEIEAQADRYPQARKRDAFRVSARTEAGIAALRQVLVEAAWRLLPKAGEVALNLRQRERLQDAQHALVAQVFCDDPLLLAEQLRQARVSFDRLLGRTTTEDLLDTVFGSFCIGK